MTKTIDRFWEAYCKEYEMKNKNYVDAFRFGVEPDWLVDLVLEGKKTATTSGHIFYEIDHEPLPKIGQYDIILNSKDEPKAVIQITSVDVLPMNEVTEEFALAEGEGDYEHWKNAHQEFFTNELAMYDLTFESNMLVVCERFKVVYT
jgi:uncharacterized protein YhfF